MAKWEYSCSMTKHVFHTNCVNSTERAITEMVDGSIDITRRTFLKYVDRDSLRFVEADLGYDYHPSMAGDWHVAYHRSKYCGKPCIYFVHSAIEYIFVQER